MSLLTAPYLAAALLLAAAGIAKARNPLALARALRSAGVPVRGPRLSVLVRAGAGIEAALGLAAIATPHRLLAGLVAASYAGFTLFVLRAMRSGSPLATCGCFGKLDTPPTRTHVAMTALLALTCTATALSPALAVTDLPLLLVTAVLAYLLYLTLALLPLVSRR